MISCIWKEVVNVAHIPIWWDQVFLLLFEYTQNQFRNLKLWCFLICLLFKFICKASPHWHRANSVWCMPEKEKLDYWNLVNFLLLKQNTLTYNCWQTPNCMCTVSISVIRDKLFDPHNNRIGFLEEPNLCLQWFFPFQSKWVLSALGMALMDL